MNWKDKIKEGYFYQIGDSNPNDEGRIFVAITGFGGARTYGQMLEDLGISDDIIQKEIKITDDDGIKTNTVFHPIKDITWYEL